MELERLFTIPAGVFLLLWALLWQPKLRPKQDDEEADDDLLLVEDVDASADDEVEVYDEDGEKPLTPKQLRGYLMRVALRVMIVIFGLLGVFVGVASGSLGTLEDVAVFALLFTLYAGLLLLVQRSEKDRRLATLFFLGVVALVIWNAAEYQDYEHANNWAVLAAVGVNFLFWLLIGRRYPPPSNVIEVEGM